MAFRVVAGCFRRRAFYSRSFVITSLSILVFITCLAEGAQNALPLRSHRTGRREADTVPLQITNNCPEIIYPGIITQSGFAPGFGGFQLMPGAQESLTIGSDWQGRVWGRTNCSFNADGTGPANNGGNNGGGQACATGDCNGVLNCMVTGNTPVTLAEFTLASSTGQTFYDISLVDGYNLPIAIVSLHAESGIADIENIPSNLTNPICIGTAGLLAAQGWDPYTSGATDYAALLGTNSSFPLPFDQQVTVNDVSSWCPWDLQLDPPTSPQDGVYSYPDNSIQRPIFDPCYSACAKWSQPGDCCTGEYNSPGACKPSAYSRDAKKICPDAYSYAFDDQTSTFIIPSGGGFGVVFCPEGRSTTILSTTTPAEAQLLSGSEYKAYRKATVQKNVAFQAVNISYKRKWPHLAAAGLIFVILTGL
ncbi:Osmotin, thaumatin-like protein [Xylona heveae TC161]|uniref:Osmotin, thaumatin-like protein n=1 Tax=Xylona heveae (strain CBS 132557 / TC161) TaxID=1328760 RepID=A0A161TDZ3_XYLHT|nr:Osmotin, thaumatin-like protein [Xylona heveae TC161]KZF24107.1 Osmotin, thaumatin-like protein [Xylona heveae TC161]